MLFPQLRDLIKLKSLMNAANTLINRTGSRLHGDYTSLFHGLGVEFETVRPYVIGDDVRHIDWRVTAKFGKAHIKTFRAECDRNVFIITDANAYMRFGTRETFKSIQAARLTALLCWQALQQQDRVGGLLFGDLANGMQYFKPTKSDFGVLRMLKAMCSQEINRHDLITPSAAINHATKIVTPQSLVFIISDFSLDSMAKLEKNLFALSKKCTLVLLPIFDPADHTIPAVGPLVCTNGANEVTINTNDAAARSAYQAVWQRYYTDMQQTSRKIKAPILWVETTTDLIKFLYRIDKHSWHRQSIALEEDSGKFN